ncbi:hypothetical protein ACIBG8_54395 [Nonomuraea sp. NPDC050556]|uniref:hypothetical protein n=1 Tax=Nonomuraea sp. NPDC050556 TaxID=3364369 RepID=UPI0037A8CA24
MTTPDAFDAPGDTPLDQIRYNITTSLHDALYAMQETYTGRVSKPNEWNKLIAELTAISSNFAIFCQQVADMMATVHANPSTIADAAAAAADPIVMLVPDRVHQDLADDDSEDYAEEILSTIDAPQGSNVLVEDLDGGARVIITYHEDPARPELIAYGGADNEMVEADLTRRGLKPRAPMWTPSPELGSKFYSIGDWLFDGYGRLVREHPPTHLIDTESLN